MSDAELNEAGATAWLTVGLACEWSERGPSAYVKGGASKGERVDCVRGLLEGGRSKVGRCR